MNLNKKQIIQLLQISGIGRKSLFSIMKKLTFNISGTEELREFLKEIQTKNEKIPTLNELLSAQNKAEEILENCNNNEIHILLYQELPEQLKNISDPPIILFIKGNISLLNKGKLIAVIGTRKPTPEASIAAFEIGKILAKKNIGVVSGLALGCDTQAHKGCLSVKGETIAVLPSSVNDIQPVSNKNLALDILNNNGCLISEYLPGSIIYKNHYIERDRIQSGLSKGIIIIETDIKGGSMHTAEFALEYGRKIACWLPLSNISSGNNKLLKEHKAVSLKTTENSINTFINETIYSKITKFGQQELFT
jgi:DNA processing protein